MIRGLYSAASGLKAMSINQDVTARNISHANKPGFRRYVAVFESFGTRRDAHVGTDVKVFDDFTVGDHNHTGRDLDVALADDGFFVIDDPSGPLYTRMGVFTLNAQGQLVTFDGRGVQGVDGPVVFPPNTKNITITDDGSIVADGQQIGKLRVVKFADNRVLQRAGNTLFRAPPNTPLQQAGTDGVRQYYRERSNGEMVGEMVSMIHGLRHYEAAQRALRSLSDVVEFNTRPRT